jgi:hypothetical protein
MIVDDVAYRVNGTGAGERVEELDKCFNCF